MPEKTKPQGALKRNVSLGHHSFYRRKEESIKSEWTVRSREINELEESLLEL